MPRTTSGAQALLPVKRRLFRAAAAICFAALVCAAQTPPPSGATIAATDSTANTAADSLARKRGQLTDTVRYEADIIRYDLVNRSVLLAGHAVARYDNVTLEADTIHYAIDDNLFYAIGAPRLKEGGDITVGDTMLYNIRTRRGSVRYATTRTGQEYFTGQQIVKTEDNELYIRDGDYTTCAYLDHPHFSFYGHELKIIPKKQGLARPVVLNIGEAPVAAFPYYILPLERGRRSGILTPGWGGHPTRGGYLDNVGYYWAASDYMDFTLAGRIKEFNDFVLTGQTRYAKRYWLSGSITANYHLNTSDFRGDRKDWAIAFSHNQNLLPDGSFTLSGGGNLSGRTDDTRKGFYQAYSDYDELIIQQTLKANLALEKRLPNLNSSVRLSWDRTHNLTNDHITEDIPTLSFALPNRPIIPSRDKTPGLTDPSVEPKWYEKIYYSYGLNGRVYYDHWANDSLKAFTAPGLAQTFNLSSPQKLFKYITITPQFSARLSSVYGYTDTTANGYILTYPIKERDTLSILHPDSTYEREDRLAVEIDTIYRDELAIVDSTTRYRLVWRDADPDSAAWYDTTWDGSAHDLAWNAGVSVSTKLYGVFPIRLFGLAGIRHTLSPSVSYRYVPEHDQDKRPLAGVVAWDNGSRRQQVIDFRLDNDFQGKITKKAEKESDPPSSRTFQMFNLSLNTSYDFEADSLRWRDLQMSAGTQLKFMRLGFNSRYWWYKDGPLGGDITLPIINNYSFSIEPQNFSVGGRFWDGDLLVLNNVQPVDPVEYRGAGLQQWRLSLSPRFSYTSSRKTPDDEFVPVKTYSMSANASVGLSRHWTASWNSTYDFVQNSFVSHALNFRCDLECWDLVFNWTPKGVRPGYYYFRVNIKKIPDIKWEERK